MGVKDLAELIKACKTSCDLGIAAILKEEQCISVADKHTKEECHKKKMTYQYAKLVGEPVELWSWCWKRGVQLRHRQGIFDFSGDIHTAYIGEKRVGIHWDDFLDGNYWIKEAGPLLEPTGDEAFVDVPRGVKCERKWN